MTPRRLQITGILCSLVITQLLLASDYYKWRGETTLIVQSTLIQIISNLGKQQEGALTIVVHSAPDLSYFKINKKEKSQKITKDKDNSRKQIKEPKTKQKSNEEDPIKEQWKLAQSLAGEVFEMTKMAQDTICEYPANQTRVYWKSDPIYNGLYRKAIISFTSQDLVQ